MGATNVMENGASPVSQVCNQKTGFEEKNICIRHKFKHETCIKLCCAANDGNRVGHLLDTFVTI